MSFLAKSIFISSLITASFVSVSVGVLAYFNVLPNTLSWLNSHQALALILSGIGFLTFIGYIFIAMRFSKSLAQRQAWWLIFGGVGAIALLMPLQDKTSTLLSIWALVIGVIGPLAYVYWYSLFDKHSQAALTDLALPSMTLQLVNNHTVHTDSLTGLNLWVFFRGNWCPVCMVQLNELATSYQAIASKGVQTFMVSPQPESQSAKLAQQIKAPMQFVVDTNSTLAKAIGINASGGLPTGLQLLGYDSDVPMPTVLLTDGNKIVWSAQTDNYRVRPEPEVFLAAIEAYQAQK